MTSYETLVIALGLGVAIFAAGYLIGALHGSRSARAPVVQPLASPHRWPAAMDIQFSSGDPAHVPFPYPPRPRSEFDDAIDRHDDRA